MVLRRAGSWNIVNGTKQKPETGGEDWEKKAEEALTYIGLTVETSQYSYIRDAKNGIEAWSALKEIYEKNSRAARITLKRQFYGYEHDENRSIAEYISDITNLAGQLKSLGITLTDTDIIDVLIFNLHESWGNLAASLTAASGELKINDVTGTLLDEEGRRGKPELDDLSRSTAFYGKAQRRTQDRRTCYRCNRTGHIAADCHAKKDADGKEISQYSVEVNLNDIAY